jgi:hypothetical protein
MAVFHSDFNVGYPAVRLVARAICAHAPFGSAALRQARA